MLGTIYLNLDKQLQNYIFEENLYILGNIKDLIEQEYSVVIPTIDEYDDKLHNIFFAHLIHDLDYDDMLFFTNLNYINEIISLNIEFNSVDVDDFDDNSVLLKIKEIKSEGELLFFESLVRKLSQNLHIEAPILQKNLFLFK